MFQTQTATRQHFIPKSVPSHRPNFSRGKTARIYAPDRIGIVGFNTAAFVIAPPTFAHHPSLQEQSQGLSQHVKGVTNMTDGLRVAIEIYLRVPRGILRRIWLLTDGYPTNANGYHIKDTSELMQMVECARANFININTIGFGDQYDEALLRKIAAATHNGKFVPVNSLRELTNALVGCFESRSHRDSGNNNNGMRKRHRRSETTVLAIDLSGSMKGPMEGKTKVQVVEEAILHLLKYKQMQFS